MNLLFEEDGAFRAGSILADNTTSLQVELPTGKRSKVKAANVLMRFAAPSASELLQRAEADAEDIEVEFLWEVCPDAEFGFEELAADQPGESADLPFMTQITVAISDVVTKWWFVWIPGSILATIGFFQWKKTDSGRRQWDAIKLRLPFKIGDVVQKVALARWSRTFSGTVASGVPILQSVQITGDTSGNVLISEAMEDVYASVKSGGSIAHPVQERADLFPPMVSHMVSVGEESGQLEHMLTKIADFYEAEVDAKVKALTSLLEPVMIVFVGGVVGMIVISMYLPIFSLYDKIK